MSVIYSWVSQPQNAIVSEQNLQDNSHFCASRESKQNNEMVHLCGVYVVINVVKCYVSTCYFLSVQGYYTIQCHLITTAITNNTNIDGLVQDCSNSIVNALELLQSCTKPSISCWRVYSASHKLCTQFIVLVFLWVYFRSWLIHVIHLLIYSYYSFTEAVSTYICSMCTFPSVAYH